MADEATSMQDEIDQTMAAVTPEPLVTMIEAMVADLRDRGVVPGLAPGDLAPDFDLPDATGGRVRLHDRLAAGPVVLTFYRGAWCPACNIELRRLQDALPELRARGASLVAVSPQSPDDSLTFAERLTLGFDVLSDIDHAVAAAYRVRFTLSDEIIGQYRQWGMVLPDMNPGGTWDLPVPATFVIDPGGTVRARHVDPDYRRRMDPAEVLAALDALAG